MSIEVGHGCESWSVTALPRQRSTIKRQTTALYNAHQLRQHCPPSSRLHQIVSNLHERASRPHRPTETALRAAVPRTHLQLSPSHIMSNIFTHRSSFIAATSQIHASPAPTRGRRPPQQMGISPATQSRGEYTRADPIQSHIETFVGRLHSPATPLWPQ